MALPLHVPIRALALVVLTSAAFAQLASDTTDAPLRPAYRPHWAGAPVLRDLRADFDPSLSPSDNGALLRQTILGLDPGDRLTVGPGAWSIEPFFEIDVRGTAAAPIRIVGEDGAVLTRSDPWQNVLNFGAGGGAPAGYLLLRGFEITGGGFGIRVREAEQLWIDRCHVHDVAGNGIAANTHDTYGLRVTRCEVTGTGGTGEALYIGSNGGGARAYDGVFAQNHVHHTGGSQGDGIELKQGSQGCLIAENVIHDTYYPGLIVYGTDGGPINTIENNVVWNTQTNPFQIQGEALVRGNVVFARNGPAFQSGPHQGEPTNLAVVQNTFIAENGRAATISSWGGKPGMALVGNVFCARNDYGLWVNGGLAGVPVEGNVVTGGLYAVGAAGFATGGGLADFVDATWDGTRRDVHPHPAGALVAQAHPRPAAAPLDHQGAVRGALTPVGALEAGTWGRYDGPWALGTPRMRLRAPATATSVDLRVEGLTPGAEVWLLLASEDGGREVAWRRLRADGGGVAHSGLALPPGSGGTALRAVALLPGGARSRTLHVPAP